MLTKTLWDFFFLTKKTTRKTKRTRIVKHVFTGLEMPLHLSWLAFTKLLCAHAVIARVGKRGEWEMTVNYLSSEGQETETRVSVSLQLHSDSRLNKEVVPQAPWAAPLWEAPELCLGRARGKRGALGVVSRAPSSGINSEEWDFWWVLSVLQHRAAEGFLRPQSSLPSPRTCWHSTE